MKGKTKKKKYFPGNKTVKDNVTRETHEGGKIIKNINVYLIKKILCLM